MIKKKPNHTIYACTKFFKIVFMQFSSLMVSKPILSFLVKSIPQINRLEGKPDLGFSHLQCGIRYPHACLKRESNATKHGVGQRDINLNVSEDCLGSLNYKTKMVMVIYTALSFFNTHLHVQTTTIKSIIIYSLLHVFYNR